MKLSVVQGSIQAIEVDTLIVNLFEGVTSPAGATGAVDQALNGAIGEVIASGDFSGKAGEIAALYPRGAIPAKRVLVVGLGKSSDFDLDGVRKAAAVAIKRARKLNARNVATIVHGASLGGLPAAEAAQATAEGSLLALYRFAADKRKPAEVKKIDSLTFVEFDESKIPEIEAGIGKAKAIAAGVYLARDLVNMPANVATPTRMAEEAAEISAAHGLGLTVGGRDWAAERDMGAFLSVAKGAGEPPKFIVLEHNADRRDLDTIVLVGKGITFDTGGISLKPVQGMGSMKADMAAAAAVLGAMKSVAMLELPLRVIGITPCTENMPDANAYRPADVIKASNGKTIEIISTDAEGRMVLADGLVYAGQYEPDAVVDLATLTGAVVVALGKGIAAGLFSNDEALRDKLVDAAEVTSERLWPMPLWEDYKKAIKSNVADMKNSGGKTGGVATSAIFLKEFTDYPWAHIDMASMNLTEKSTEYIPVGGTGYGVRLLIEFLQKWRK
jgi:leucyl aminopeptidase